MLHLSPTFKNGKPKWLCTSSTTKSSSPDNHIFGRPTSGSLRGAYFLAASAIAWMCGGVVPQHPPTMLIHPFSKKTELSRAMSAGVSSYPPMAFGRPALQYTSMKHSATFASLSRNGVICCAPKAQFNPKHIGFACLTDA